MDSSPDEKVLDEIWAEGFKAKAGLLRVPEYRSVGFSGEKTACIVVSQHRRAFASAENVLKLDQEINVQAQGDGQQNQSDDGEGADTAADGAQVFDKFLLLQGITVGGFADALQLVFDALEGGALLDDLAAQFAMTGANLGEAALDGLQIDMDLMDLLNRGRRRRVMMAELRSDQGGDGGGEVAVEERKKPLHQRYGGADCVDGALEAGFGGVRIGRRGQSCLRAGR
jgi:hypothetical protein